MPAHDDHNLVADLHNVVARAADPVQASTRPAGTTRLELALMRRDVLRRLSLFRGASVLEIGCGTGLFAEPLAAAGATYVGVDFAAQAIEVLKETAGSGPHVQRIRAHCIDAIADPERVRELGAFDRVLMYAVLHYARTDEDGRRLLSLAAAMLAPGGRALIGNLPLEDLSWELTGDPPAAGRLRSLLIGERSPLPTPAMWRLRSALFMRIKSLAVRGATVPSPTSLPSGYTVSLSRAGVEGWLPDGVSHTWRRPAVGAPLHLGRADLILVKDG